MTETLPHPATGDEPVPGPPVTGPLVSLATRLDGHLTAPVVVLDPSPAAPRRLTVLAGPQQLAVLESALAADGFVARGALWARFDVDGALAVELQHLPGDLVPAAGLDGGMPAFGTRWLLRLPQDPAGRPLAASSPARRGSRRRTPLVSISGPDGTGKSTQIAALRATFESIGLAVAAAWAPTITRTRSYSLRRFGRRRPLPAVAPVAVPPAPAAPEVDTAPSAPAAAVTQPARPGRGGRPQLVESAWAAVIAVRNAGEMWRHVFGAPSVDVLVLDRFTLDARVKLEYWYGERRGLDLRFHRRLFAAIAPRADVAVLLVVPVERNRARRPEDWSAEQLASFWRLYHEVAQEAGAVVVDGDRPIAEVAADVARSVWRSLP